MKKCYRKIGNVEDFGGKLSWKMKVAEKGYGRKDYIRPWGITVYQNSDKEELMLQRNGDIYRHREVRA